MNRLKVLLVDDSEEFATAAVRHLATLPWAEVIGRARNGVEAVDMTTALAPELVLMDLVMPKMGGLEALRRIKRLPKPPRVVMLTLHDQAEYRHHALEAGAAAYVSKSEFQHKLSDVVCQLFGPARNHDPRPAEAALVESEARFRATFEQAAVGIAHVAPDGRWLLVNQKLCDIVGYTREELLQKTFADITHPDDLDPDLANVRKMLAGELANYSLDKRYIRKDSSIVWAALTVALVRDGAGAPDYFISVVEDISERKRAEDEVRLLQSIALAIGEAPDLEAGLETVLREVSMATGWAYGEAWLPCEENAHLQCATAFYGGEGKLQDFVRGSRTFRFARGEGLPGRVWDSCRPLWIPDVRQDANFPRAALARAADLRAALGVPVLVGEEIVAILAFYLHEERPQDERLVSIVTTVAAQLGQVIYRKRVEEALQDSEIRLRAIFDAEPECVKVMQADGMLVQINQAGLAMIGAEHTDAVVGQSVCGIVLPEHRAQFQAFCERVARGARENLQFEIETLKGERRWVETHAVPFRTPSTNGTPLVLAVTRDITARKQAEERLLYLAHHDQLTSLPNRALFTDRLRQAMIDATRHDRLVAVVFLDLDQFKNVNDSLGHDAGDALLCATGERLQTALRTGDTVARLSGDEFGLLLTDIAHVDDVTTVLQKIMAAFTTPFRIDGRELFIHASLGITLYPFDDREPRDLLRNADIAMYRAKERGRNTWQFYAAEMTARATETMTLAAALHGAIERDELRLHYQPLINIESGRIVGVEALLRWQHPELGLVSPAKFIPIAEETGMIVPIGEWVLHTACTQMRAWHTAGFDHLRLAVNLSPRQFRESDLSAVIGRILAATQLPAAALELELTEGMLLQKSDSVGTMLEQIDALGLHLSIDDFGTGYSCLAYLKRLPIDTLKIDQSFVRDIATDPDDANIVKTIIAMAQNLGKRVVAEGVETAEQLEFLRDNDCNDVQGYFFSRPAPSADIERLLEKERDSA